MTPSLHATHAAPADLLRFGCGHCGSLLEVPASLAGVQGPCPKCGGEITAPQWVLPVAGAVANGAANLMAKPPPRRDIPPPLALVGEDGPGPEAVHPVPPVAPAALESVQPSFPVLTQSGGGGLSPDVFLPAAKPPRENKRLFPTDTRGIFNDSMGSTHPPLDINRKAPALRRHGWQRWLDLGVVAVFTGVLLATLAALRFTVPLEVKPVAGLPPNLNELVEKESQYVELRRMEAGALAQASVNRYLGAASEQAAASHLLPPPDGMISPPFPPFAGPLPAAYSVQSSRRIAGTDRFLVVVEPKEQPGPIFVVEQTESGPRLHAGAISQQSAGLFERFTATPGEGEATLYTEVRPTEPGYEREYRVQRPDLAGFRFVDVRSAFPVTVPPVIACFKPDSDAARSFSRRAHDPKWRAAIVQLRWQRHREAGPYVELVSFITGPWSGERIILPPQTTAATSP